MVTTEFSPFELFEPQCSSEGGDSNTQATDMTSAYMREKECWVLPGVQEWRWRGGYVWIPAAMIVMQHFKMRTSTFKLFEWWFSEMGHDFTWIIWILLTSRSIWCQDSLWSSGSSSSWYYFQTNLAWIFDMSFITHRNS